MQGDERQGKAAVDLPAITKELREWRDKIDEIDRQLVELLCHRAACVLEIARLKRAAGIPVYEPRREEEIFGNIREANHGPLSDPAIRRVFERIIDENRSIQREPMNIPRAGEGEATDTELNQAEKD